MDLAFLAVMYFFVVVIIVLSFLLVKEKQLMYRLLDERDILQEDLNALRIEKVRINHGPMEDDKREFQLEELDYEEELPSEIEEPQKPRKHLESVFAENGTRERTHAATRNQMIDKPQAKREPVHSEVRDQVINKEQSVSERARAEAKSRMIDREQPVREPVRAGSQEMFEEEEPYIVLNNRSLSRYEDELFRREE